MLFLGIISWKGLHVSVGGGCFSDGKGSIFKLGASLLMGGGGVQKNCRMGGALSLPPHPYPLWETLEVGVGKNWGLGVGLHKLISPIMKGWGVQTMSCDHNLWCLCVKWWCLQILGLLRWGEGVKVAGDHDFWYTFVKWCFIFWDVEG